MSRLTAFEHPAPSFSLRLQSSPAVGRLGQEIAFRIESARDCYGTLLERGSSGSINVLFVDRPLSSGLPYLVFSAQDAFALRCIAPVGREELCLVATLQPIFTSGRGLRATSRAMETAPPHFSAILEHVRALPLSEWASAFCEFFIEL